ncbi:protein-glutamine gamma-glutamyltransferase [Clostridium sp. P21]|uniref:Protein-glutamine gamma-glutamyltransferase n=1 Tax=Clostridium muellerianum TaxID=2716538 RepID=A0A7Y0EIQ4_9CLOT|nr:protein-glutamine gamma-glutamyltransferase [Clostridium muellerianum]NMM63882.1 protein-glutamine gamma-glutamyltransferase [Clostridium muellerianum]
MIKISDSTVSKNELMKGYQINSMENKIINKLFLSKKIYTYSSLNELKFQLNLQTNICVSAKDMSKSNLLFKVFRKSKCNSKYWDHTNEGGFLLKKEVKPSDAIKDIFINSSKYGTECSTAIVIIYYKALVNVLPEKLFNKMFPNIHLLNWHYLNENLYIEEFRDETDVLMGDCKYFKNPDVNPLTPQWQGENTIYLGNGTYYGHGLGVKNTEEIIKSLNKNRKIAAKQSAFLLNSATRLNYKHLYDECSSILI